MQIGKSVKSRAAAGVKLRHARCGAASHFHGLRRGDLAEAELPAFWLEVCTSLNDPPPREL